MYVLSELFGNCPQVKILETFAEYYDDTLSGSDIMQMTDVSKATIYSHIDKLLKEGIIKKARKVGKTQLYQLNSNNPKAKIILMLERFIVAERLEKMVEKEPATVVSEYVGVPGIIQCATTPTPETALNISIQTSAPCGICATAVSDEDWRILYG
jgi:DNA-binding transcriptional ArsR family regulator